MCTITYDLHMKNSRTRWDWIHLFGKGKITRKDSTIAEIDVDPNLIVFVYNFIYNFYRLASIQYSRTLLGIQLI